MVQFIGAESRVSGVVQRRLGDIFSDLVKEDYELGFGSSVGQQVEVLMARKQNSFVFFIFLSQLFFLFIFDLDVWCKFLKPILQDFFAHRSIDRPKALHQESRVKRKSFDRQLVFLDVVDDQPIIKSIKSKKALRKNVRYGMSQLQSFIVRSLATELVRLAYERNRVVELSRCYDVKVVLHG